MSLFDASTLLAASVVAQLSACSRNAVMVIENRTALKLSRRRCELSHGSFHADALPCEAVAPGHSNVVAVQSVGVLVGCEFAIEFSLEPAHNVSFYACTPFIGSPLASSTSLLALGIDCRVLHHFERERRLWVFHFVLIEPTPLPVAVRWRGADLSLARPEHKPEGSLSAHTKGQMLVRVEDCIFPASLPTSNARSFFYLQVLRVRNVSPVDTLPPAGLRLQSEAAAQQFVGAHKAVLEPLFWSQPQFVKPSECPLFDETFVVNVDDVLRDGVCVRLIEYVFLGVKQRVISERTILASSVLPDAQRRTLSASLGEQLTHLEKLESQYRIIYAAEAHMLERMRMRRDIDALKESLRLLDENHRAAKRSDGIGASCRFVSTELSAPSDLQHSLHIGIDRESGRFATRNIPPEWQRLFDKAGVLRTEIDDLHTFTVLMATIGDLAPLTAETSSTVSLPSLPAAATTAAAAESTSAPADVPSPKHLFARRARIAATLALAIDVSALCSEDRPVDAALVASLRRRCALLAAASAAACNASERESDLTVAAAVAARAAQYGRCSDQLANLLGGSPGDAPTTIDQSELDADAADELSSSFSEQVIDVERLPNVPLLPPRVGMPAAAAAVVTTVPPLPPPTPTPPPAVVVDEPHEHARLSVLDQIRQGTSLRSSASLPPLKLAAGDEDVLVNALHRAVLRRREAMKASSD
jgi:hypothetical protein